MIVKPQLMSLPHFFHFGWPILCCCFFAAAVYSTVGLSVCLSLCSLCHKPVVLSILYQLNQLQEQITMIKGTNAMNNVLDWQAII